MTIHTYVVQLKSGQKVLLMGSSQTTIYLTVQDLYPGDPPVRVYREGDW